MFVRGPTGLPPRGGPSEGHRAKFIRGHSELPLRSLIVALREIGHRNTEENSGALRAAEAVERALHGARGQGARVSPGMGRSLIERLQTDPLAVL